ncbi:pimeloyl-ACP methyl ester carboxylesterase [Friedmanniella endophytica]|uniref:Pimeloyl-ACP methyl ester carboxylesterase n=1 Tax=Microlunatus kandeliicorticis TaxID=1759536 RepID=A0A7W3P458_9ACTN|nr:alpha/beta hydrolase [Microlunatus kandeliicorticis]MBA8792554.1 pimeloyl-ACP methyl ester carboxylesterase [Microlunatus kandeliicorticis]
MPGHRPTVFALHGLGLSHRLFDPVADRLADLCPVGDPDGLDLIALDLPGFGDRAGDRVDGLETTVDAVVRAIAAAQPSCWLLLGHSMGAKIVTLVAARTLQGATPLFGLRGVVLLAGSPPSPEPMDEDRRATMIDWVARGPMDDDAANAFVDANVGGPLRPEVRRMIIDDLRRCSPTAWRDWLERGSRTDVSGEVGALPVPALIVAGGSDGDLGPDAQRDLNGPVYPRHRVRVLDGAGHLLPVERPAEVAEAVLDFWRSTAGRGPRVSDDVAAVIGSDRTSPRTRAALAERALPDVPDAEPQVLDRRQLATLGALAEVVVPQTGPTIDLARRVDRALADGGGDGWRHDGLPGDVEAYRAALDALEGLTDLDAAQREAILAAVADGDYAPVGSRLTAAQLRLWFDDLRVDLVRPYVTHPATMARIGYDGWAGGADAPRQQGFRLIGADEREPWEPGAGAAEVTP